MLIQDLVNAEVIRYKSFDGLEIPAILYKPHQASKLNKVPALFGYTEVLVDNQELVTVL